MTVLERIKTLCKEKGISITTLEQILEYSNGSLAKAKDIPSSRIRNIAEFFNVSTDYLLTGKEKEIPLSAQADLWISIRNDKELLNALEKYMRLSDRKKKHVIDTIDVLSEV
jgi:transcriptional regulator with XRE-family HTH domain